MGFIQYTRVQGGDIDVADQVYLYTTFLFIYLFFFPFSDPVLRWGVTFSDDLDLFFFLFLTSSAQPVLVGKETL